MRNFILDIDGTLWNTTGVVAGAWNKAVMESGYDHIVITDKILQKEFGKTMDVIADDLFIGLDAGKKAELLELCCKYEHEAIEENEEDLTYPKVRETIVKLARDSRLFIVSNCQNGYIELVMIKNHIEDMITDFECFGRTKLSKGQNIKLLMERNNITEAYYVGDTMGDYEASNEGGTRFVFAAYGFGDVPEAAMKIEKFSELLSI